MDVPVHVVVDGGLDDALALAVLVALEVPLAQVIATEGSVDRLTTAATTARFLATVGCSVAVRLGAETGYSRSYPDGRDPFHGPDCFGGQGSLLAGAEVPDEGCAPLDGPVFCTGALTVVARGLDVHQPIADVVWMGGSLSVGGNMTATAEFNAWMDPSAADRVLRSGRPLRMVPLDVTTRFSWAGPEIEALRGAGRVGAILAQALALPVERDGVFVPHDAVAALALTHPNLFAWRARDVGCETAGLPRSGQTIVDRATPAGAGVVTVAEDVDVAHVTARIVEAVGRLG